MAEAKKPIYRYKKWKLGNSYGWWRIPYCPYCKRKLGLMAKEQRPEKCPMCGKLLDWGGTMKMAEYIEREALMRRIKEIHCAECDSYHGVRCRACWVDDTLDYIDSEPAADVEKMSDGYHTFADLYEQRLILSAALAKNNPHAWKSKRHEDGSVPFGGGWFIMGFDTDEGCYTYHYELKDWDLFQCRELVKGKPWDGHTSKDVRRLLSIPAADVAPVVHGRWILEAHDERVNYRWNVTSECSECCDEQKEIWAGFFPNVPPPIARDVALVSAESVKLSNYCPNCGARMDGGSD